MSKTDSLFSAFTKTFEARNETDMSMEEYLEFVKFILNSVAPCRSDEEERRERLQSAVAVPFRIK